MGLKLTKEIGTSKGITNECYIRVNNLRISKSSGGYCDLEIYQSKDEAPKLDISNPRIVNSTSISELIGNNFHIPFYENVPVDGENNTIKTILINQEYKKLDIYSFFYDKLKLHLEKKLDQKIEDC